MLSALLYITPISPLYAFNTGDAQSSRRLLAAVFRLFRDLAFFLASRPFSAVAELGGGGHALCSTSHRRQATPQASQTIPIKLRLERVATGCQMR